MSKEIYKKYVDFIEKKYKVVCVREICDFMYFSSKEIEWMKKYVERENKNNY